MLTRCTILLFIIKLHKERNRMTTQESKTFEDGRVYNAREVAANLGVSIPTVHDWVKRDGLPMKAMGKAHNSAKYILGEDLKRWIRGYRS